MRWSWKLGTFSGIGVYIHATFLLLIGWILLTEIGHGVANALLAVLFILLLFTCVALHEFGHALMGQQLGIQTRDITLYPIGGVARLERIPRDPRQELLIALAGPAVNVVIAAALFIGLLISGQVIRVQGFSVEGSSLIVNLMMANVMLVAFNLLPAFPMDGGRVLRAFLATRMEYGKATQTAAAIGQAMALGFGLIGLLNPGGVWFLFIAFFVYIGASQEAAMVETELAFRGVPAGRAMMTRFATLSPDNSLAQAVEQLLAGAQHDFPVVEDGRVVGMLTRSSLIQTLSERGPGALVAEAMSAAPPTASPSDSLEAVFQQMRGADTQAVPVLQDGQLLGLLTMENIGELLMVRTAWEQSRGRTVPEGSTVHRRAGEEESDLPRRPWAARNRRRAGL